jgi:hypothetical protein
MDLAAIQISKDEAREKLDEYASFIYEERTAEDDAIAAGYRAAARGLPVISLSRTIASGGFHGNSLPRIAVVRADATECFARWSGNDVIFADRDGRDVNRGALVGTHSVRVSLAGDELPERMSRRTWTAGSTMVPIVPPCHRPKRSRLRRCHILWEVEDWTYVPPVDPALLRHIRGDLWAVLAAWDLTELERLVLTQRAR